MQSKYNWIKLLAYLLALCHHNRWIHFIDIPALLKSGSLLLNSFVCWICGRRGWWWISELLKNQIYLMAELLHSSVSTIVITSSPVVNHHGWKASFCGLKVISECMELIPKVTCTLKCPRTAFNQCLLLWGAGSRNKPWKFSRKISIPVQSHTLISEQDFWDQKNLCKNKCYPFYPHLFPHFPFLSC